MTEQYINEQQRYMQQQKEHTLDRGGLGIGIDFSNPIVDPTPKKSVMAKCTFTAWGRTIDVMQDYLDRMKFFKDGFDYYEVKTRSSTQFMITCYKEDKEELLEFARSKEGSRERSKLK